MISNQTILILGAGASEPYGMPLGSGLKERILDIGLGRSGGKPFTSITAREDLGRFTAAFHASRLFSIDAFLANRPEFSEIGKLCIAAVMLDAEANSPFARNAIPPDWMDYLWNRIAAGTSWDTLYMSNLAVITFNYDRLLETFLLRAMMGTFPIKQEEAIQRLSTLRVEHVYGSLGPLWGAAQPSDVVPFGAAVDSALIHKAAKNIQVIPESRDDAPSFKRAQAWLKEADRICVLGFGFDELNVRRLDAATCLANPLKLPSGTRGRIVTASGYGLTVAQVRANCLACGGLCSLPGLPELWTQSKCYDTLLETLPLQ